MARGQQAKAAIGDLPVVPKQLWVELILQREVGATLAELCEATCWQEHTCGAFLTEQRKKSLTIIRKANNGNQRNEGHERSERR